MGRSSGAYLARPRAEFGGTVAAGARGGPGHGRARGSRRRDGGERERHGRSPWKVPGERCVRVISRGGRPGVGMREIRPRVSRMTRRCSRRRCRRSVVSGVRSFDCALLRFAASTSDIQIFSKPKKILLLAGKKNFFLRLGRIQLGHSVQIILTVNPHRDQWRLGVDAGMEIGRPMASLERAFSASAVASDDTIE